MGYDYPECIGCYCKAGFNSDSDVEKSVCIDCMRNFTSLSGRARYYGEEVFSTCIDCDICKKEREGYTEIPLCNSCNEDLEEANQQ